MGTWGPGNLSSDGALDLLSDRSEKLIDETLKLAASEAAAEYDDIDYDKLFVNFEIIFALERSRLLRCHPDPEDVARLRDNYLAAWDRYTKKNRAEWPERRAIIAKSFDHLIWISRVQKRREDGVRWVVVEPPTLRQLSDTLSLAPHSVLSTVTLSIPTTWAINSSTDTARVSSTALIHDFIDPKTRHFVVGQHRFNIDGVFSVTGRSLLPDEVPARDDPYLLIAKLRVCSGNKAPEVFGLVLETKDSLTPYFQGQGEHVTGVLYIDTLKDFEFDGLRAFRPQHLDPTSAPRIRSQHLYYHRLSDDTLLLLETGSIEDSVGLHFPDKVLIGHIVHSLKPASAV